MSIASEITRISENIAAAYTALDGKGATLPATQNSANLADTIDTITTGGGGGATVKRGDWIVPQEFIALDNATLNIKDTYYSNTNNVSICGIYFTEKAFLSDNTYYFFYPSNATYTARAFTANGEKTITSETLSNGYVYGKIVLENDEDYLIMVKAEKAGKTFTRAGLNDDLLPPSRTSYLGPIELKSEKASIGYITTLNCNLYNMIDTYINLAEIHSLNNSLNVVNYMSLKSFERFEYVPSMTEYNYQPSVSGFTFTSQNAYNINRTLGLLKNLPDGADFSNFTSYAWNFGKDVTDSYSLLDVVPRLKRMYITIPPVNITMNESNDLGANWGVVLTEDNWDYIVEHAPTVTGKTLTINTTNMDKLGSANKAALEAKGWTVTVIS